jgi:aspartyl-tRNA(Asn)/glutamyl-tRNA(Gln) amidotransferase subunit C
LYISRHCPRILKCPRFRFHPSGSEEAYPMSLDKATVSHIAHLARIKVDDDQLETMVGELNNILSWIEQLNEVDTEGVAPLASVTGHALPLRADGVADGGYPERVLINAPDRAVDFYSVPKVVE